MILQGQVENYREQGFVDGEKVLSEGEVDILREEIDRVIKNQDRLERKPVWIINLSGNEKAPVWQIVNICDASDAFMALVHNPHVVETAAALAGASELRLWHDQVQYKPVQIGGVNMWHQDSPYWPNLTPKNAQVTAWVALDDVDESNGCMSMVPGSHLWGDQIQFLHTLKDFHVLPKDFQGHPLKAVTCPVRKGHVHFHHPLTWHGSRANASDGPRRAIALHYITQDCRYVSQGDHPMKPFVEVREGEKLVGDRFPQVWPF
jgi:ectoine hydroxylase-related dioxygenase (phytanoyl-CoA dioxygenase family)